jgi:hypothetical protein
MPRTFMTRYSCCSVMSVPTRRRSRRYHRKLPV